MSPPIRRSTKAARCAAMVRKVSGGASAKFRCRRVPRKGVECHPVGCEALREVAEILAAARSNKRQPRRRLAVAGCRCDHRDRAHAADTIVRDGDEIQRSRADLAIDPVSAFRRQRAAQGRRSREKHENAGLGERDKPNQELGGPSVARVLPIHGLMLSAIRRPQGNPALSRAARLI